MIGFIAELFLILLLTIINNFITANFNFHTFIFDIIGGIEVLLHFSLITIIYVFFRLFVISQYRVELEKSCKSQEFYYAIKYVYKLSKRKKIKELIIGDYLHALQLEDNKVELQQVISENIMMLEKSKPLKYLHIQLVGAYKLNNQEQFNIYYQIAEKKILEKIDHLMKKNKKNKQLVLYQAQYRALQRNKQMFNKEYELVIEMLDGEPDDGKLAIVLKNIQLAECYAYLNKNVEMRKCIDLCKMFGADIPMIQRKIAEIELIV